MEEINTALSKVLVSSRMHWREGISYALTFLLLNLLFRTAAVAQGFENARSITLSGQAGFIIVHKPEVQHIAQSHPRGLRLDYALHSRGRKEWHHEYNFPTIGYSVSYFTMNAPRLLGEAFAMSAYLEPHILRNAKHQLSYRLGTGLVYNHKIFDIRTNYTNIAISTRLSFVLEGALAYTYHISNVYATTAAVQFIHYSNGAIRMPNAGINIPSFNIGMKYKLSEQWQLPERTRPPQPRKKVGFEIIGAGGIIENTPLSNKRYTSWTASAYATQRLSHKSKINLGVDGFYNLALKDLIIKDPIYRSNDFRRIGTVVGHELIIHKLSLLTQLGYYLYMPPKIHSRIYQRYGLRFNFFNGYFGTVALKSHLGRAEMIEWGLGLKL